MSAPEPTFHKLDEFEPTTAQNRDVLGHWKSIRDDQPVPLWEAFDPLDILKSLGNCAIVEFVDADQIKIRLFGNALVERLGTDPTGRNFLDLYDPDQKQDFMERTELLRTRPAVLRCIIASQSSMGVPVIAESMIFPFRDEGGAIERGLLSLSELRTDEYITQAPPKVMKGIEVLRLDVLDL